MNDDDDTGEESDKPTSTGITGRLLTGHLPLESECTWFILASALDVFMTYLALSHSEAGRTSRVIGEGNPVAAYFINRWGIKGMVYFKFAVVAFVVLLAQWIAREKIESARRLLNFGTLLVLGVVIYSFFLLLRAM